MTLPNLEAGEPWPEPVVPYGRKPLSEKNFGDELLAFWEDVDLPADAVVTHVILIPYRGDRGVLSWRSGQVALPEGDVGAGEPIDAAIRRIAVDQAGISELKSSHLGHWLCKATTRSTTQAPGTITYQAVYGIEAEAFSDFPTGEGYERRVVLQRDLVANIRSRHAESKVELMEALDRFIIDRERARKAATS